MKIIRKINGGLTIAALVSALYVGMELTFRSYVAAADKWLFGISLVWLTWVGVWTALDRKRCR